jgi:predicted O-linked N-acetylglucosamine transferase (SPINDLY family)
MTVVDTGTLMSDGHAAHQAGRLDVAEAAYRGVLAEVPDHVTALHLLGLVALQQQRLDEAATLLQRVVQLEPANASAWTHLATAHQLRRDISSEATAIDRLLALQPDHVENWGRRGVLAYEAGEIERACGYFARSVEAAPGNADAWTNLGACQLMLGRLAEAEASQRRAVAADPTSPLALNNLGNVLVARSQWAEAATTLERLVRHVPGDPNGWTNLGHALKGLKRYDGACNAYQRALAVRPDDPAALLGLGDALQGLDRPVDAIPLYERALVGLPTNADTYEHLGVALQSLGRLDDAATAYRRCLDLDPDQVGVQSGLIFVLDLMQGAEDAARAERRRWDARFGRPNGDAPVVHLNNRAPERRLRVGYVSADFRHHSAAYAMLPILRAHDRSQVSVVCYSGVTTPDQVTAEIRALADNWREMAELSDDDLAAQIRADAVDILVDLSGHSGGNRLTVFARKPAPVQVTAWGYAAGTGLTAMGYFLADPIAVPAETRGGFAEEVVDLPSILCYEPPSYAPAVAAPPASARGYVTFGAFNRLAKISERALATWAQVLAAVPSARLTIKCPGADVSPGREWLLGQLSSHGVSPDRVTLLGATPHPDHLAAYGEIDVLLDTFPQNGGITTLDSMVMGVPVVTLLGEGVPGRASGSFLTTLGLPDLVARTPDEYVAIAARLATDLDRLAHERATLRGRLLTSPLGDGGQYTRAVEAAYRQMWRRWCEGQGPRGEGRAMSGTAVAARGTSGGADVPASGASMGKSAVVASGRRGVVRVARVAGRVGVSR